MGFMKPPKISVPQAPSVVAPEPPVRVEKIEDKTVSGYNAASRRRKGILSTILAGKNSSLDPINSSGGGDALKKTLG